MRAPDDPILGLDEDHHVVILPLPITVAHSNLPGRRMWKHLDARQRRLLLLFADTGWSNKELGYHLGWTSVVVKHLLLRACRMLGIPEGRNRPMLALWVWSVVGDPREAEEYPR